MDIINHLYIKNIEVNIIYIIWSCVFLLFRWIIARLQIPTYIYNYRFIGSIIYKWVYKYNLNDWFFLTVNSYISYIIIDSFGMIIYYVYEVKYEYFIYKVVF